MGLGVIDRYVLRETIVPFVAGMMLFFVVVIFGEVLKISDSVTGLGIGLRDLGWALLYSLPPLVGLLLPVSALFSTMLGIGRIASDREVIALRVAGMSPLRLMRVPAVLGVVLGGLTLWATVWGEPWGIQGIRSIMSRGAQRALAQGVRAGEFTEWVPGVTFHVRATAPEPNSHVVRGDTGHHDERSALLYGLTFADLRDPKNPVVVAAESGQVVSTGSAGTILFDLHEGSMLLFERGKTGERRIAFATGQYRLDVAGLVNNKLVNVTAAQGMSFGRLWEGAHDSKNKRKRRAQFMVTLQRKIAIAVATLIFALLAVPLGLGTQGSARARGFLFCLVIVLGYYYIGRASELAARFGSFDPVLAAWLPNIIGLVALVFLTFRAQRRLA